MTICILIFSDYVCPFCFLAEFPLRRVAEARGAAVEWLPFELRPEPTPTLRPEDDYLPMVWRQSVYPLAASMGVPIRLPSVSPQPYSRLAFEGFQHAKAEGRADAYSDRVFRAFFQEDRDIGDPDVLATLAAEVGLDPTTFRNHLEVGTYRQAHGQALEASRALGIRSVPTVLVGRHRIEGLPREDVLKRLIDEGPETEE